MYICTYVHMYTCTYIHTYVNTYIFTFIHVHTYIYVYIYILILAYASYKTGRHFPTQRCLRQDRSAVRGVWGYQYIEVSSKAYSIRYCPIAIRGSFMLIAIVGLPHVVVGVPVPIFCGMVRYGTVCLVFFHF